MARFQTYLADLLEAQLPEIADLNWRKLIEATGVSEPTLRRWYNARVGSDAYLDNFTGTIAVKIMRYFGLERLNQIIVTLDDTSDEDSPQSFQETAGTVFTMA